VNVDVPNPSPVFRAGFIPDVPRVSPVFRAGLLRAGLVG
jgi:hypothetical protein